MTFWLAVDPGDIPDGWASIIVALITGVGGVLAVQIVSLVNTRRNKSAIENVDSKVDAIRDHTVNSHTDRNMRVEMDERYEEQKRDREEQRAELAAQRSLLERIVAEQELTRKDVGGIRAELRTERDERHELAKVVNDIRKS